MLLFDFQTFHNVVPDPFDEHYTSSTDEAEVVTSIQHGARRQTMDSNARVSEQDISVITPVREQKHYSFWISATVGNMCAQCKVDRIQTPR